MTSSEVEKVSVLMYHHINPHAGDTVTVTPEVFAAQMEFLQVEGYKTLSADDLMEFIQGKSYLCEKAVVITFDDGWFDNYLYAVPVLKRSQFKATFFVITDRVAAASKRDRLSLESIPDHETAKKLIQSGEAEQVVLDWDSIRELEGCGLFRFYSHTVTHRRSADLSPLDLQEELVGSKKSIEEALGRGCDYLCWPYGSFTVDTVAVAKGVGYKALFTTNDGYCESCSDPLMIKRIEIGNSVECLIQRLSGENL